VARVTYDMGGSNIWNQGWVETILVQLREQLLLVLKHDRVNQNHKGASKQSNDIGLSYNKTTARAVSLTISS